MVLMNTNENISHRQASQLPAAYDHAACSQCPLPKQSTAHLSRFQRAVMDALGDVHLHLRRDHESGNVWDVEVQVWSIDTPLGGGWDVEHWATTGVPAYMPPGCPEWLWVLYMSIGDLCNHFMDLHGEPEDAPNGSRLLSNDL
jgi:hypothetical protein